MTKTYTQAELDAAVEAVVEKAADKAWIACAETRHVTLGDKVSEVIRATIPTDALAEHDAKVRADALQEFSAEAINAVGFTLAHFEGELRPDGMPHEKETAVKLLRSLMQTLMPEGEPFEALIEGEA